MKINHYGISQFVQSLSTAKKDKIAWCLKDAKVFIILLIDIKENFIDSLTTNESYIMKNEKEWSNTPYCGICTMIFDKLKGVFTHHWY